MMAPSIVTRQSWRATAPRFIPSINANQCGIEVGIAELEREYERRSLFGARVMEHSGQFLGED